jgi:glycosyltransferase involved in cell wall biosynthesis
MKKKCLIIAYDYPPYSGGGVMRIHKFVKYFPEFDIEPYILTKKEKYNIVKDYSLFQEYKVKPKIFRTNTVDLKFFYHKIKNKGKQNTEISGVDSKNFLTKLLHNIQSSLFIPDLKILWLPFCLYKSVKLIKKYNITNIVTTSPPHSVQITGYLLKKIFPNINWIVDFRDLWTDYDVYNYPFKYVKYIDEFFEKIVLKNADKLVCATESVKQKFMNKKYIKNKSKFYVVYNGYDKHDFENCKVELNKQDCLNMVYTGSLNDWRNLDNLIIAVNQLLKENKINRNKIRINFYGYIPEREINNIIKNHLSEIFVFHKSLSHRDTIKKMLENEVLLLIIGKLEGKEVLTGKIFEYIGAKKDIFGIVPENGEAYNFIKDNRLGYVCSTDSVYDIKQKFLKMYNDYHTNNFQFTGNPEILEKFSRKNLTEKFSGFIK